MNAQYILLNENPRVIPLCSTRAPFSHNVEHVSSDMSSHQIQSPVVQSIVSLASSSMIKMLTVLVSTIPKSQVFLLKKCEMQKLLTFFLQIY